MKENNTGKDQESEMHDHHEKLDLTFEEALKKLEEVVQHLEEGNLSLEDSLRYFQEGIRLSRTCREILVEAEYKVEYLLKEVENETNEKDNFISSPENSEDEFRSQDGEDKGEDLNGR